MADIVIYGRASCVQCKASAREAERLGLDYMYVDLDHDIAAAARLINSGYRELPVVEFGDQVWTGFQPARLQEARRAKP